MVNHEPPLPTRLVGEVLRTGRMPNHIVAALSDWFRVTKEDSVTLSVEKRYIRGVYSFLAHLASGVEPVPRFERVVLIQFDLD